VLNSTHIVNLQSVAIGLYNWTSDWKHATPSIVDNYMDNGRPNACLM